MMRRSSSQTCAFVFLAGCIACQNTVIVPNPAANGDWTGDTISAPDSEVPDIDTEPRLCENEADTASLACDDFEHGLPATAALNNGLVSLDADTVFSGNRAMRSATQVVNAWAFAATSFAPIESGTVYFRQYIFIPEGTIVGRITVINLSGTKEPTEEISYGVDVNLTAGGIVDIYLHGNKTRYASAALSFPEGEWFCLRGSYTISDTAGETSVWINDSLAVSTTATSDSIINGGVSETAFGIVWTELGQDTAVVYIDNILVSSAPVHC